MNKRLKKIFFIIWIIFFIILLMYIIYSSKIDFKNNSKNNESIANKKKFNGVERISNRSEFYEVKNCVYKFFSGCNSINNPEGDIIFLTLNDIISLLDKDYIKFANITANNISDKIKPYNGDEIQINNMLLIQEKNNLSLYLVEFNNIIKADDSEEKFKFLVKRNKNNNLFSIYLDDYVVDNEYDKLEIGENKNIQLNDIEEEKLNYYTDLSIDMSVYKEDLFNDFKKSCLYYKERAYSLLDDDQRKNEYKTFDEFSKYLKENTVDIVTMKINQCDVIDKDGYMEFNYTTNKRISFTIKEISPMKYTVIINNKE